MRHVLDASAILALLLGERGADLVEAVLETACMGSVNLAEVVTVLTRRGGEPDQVRAVVDVLGVPTLVAERSLALASGLLWSATRVAGSSLGDRFALALADQLDATLVTSDMRLAGVAPSVGVAVMAIR